MKVGDTVEILSSDIFTAYKKQGVITDVDDPEEYKYNICVRFNFPVWEADFFDNTARFSADQLKLVNL